MKRVRTKRNCLRRAESEKWLGLEVLEEEDEMKLEVAREEKLELEFEEKKREGEKKRVVGGVSGWCGETLTD